MPGPVPMLDKPPSLHATSQQAKKLDPALLARFAAIVGDKFAITDPDLQAPYLVEMRNMFQGHTPVVLRPASVAEVSAILKLANDTGTAIVPQGGNTGLVGGQIPLHNEIVLSLNRMDRIREVDPTSNTITCEAGVTLQRTREAAAEVDRFVRLVDGRAKIVLLLETPPRSSACTISSPSAGSMR